MSERTQYGTDSSKPDKLETYIARSSHLFRNRANRLVDACIKLCITCREGEKTAGLQREYT